MTCFNEIKMNMINITAPQPIVTISYTSVKVKNFKQFSNVFILNQLARYMIIVCCLLIFAIIIFFFTIPREKLGVFIGKLSFIIYYYVRNSAITYFN